MKPEYQTQYEIVAGFFLPLLLSVILQRHWSSAVKSYVSFGVVLLASIGSAYFQGRLAGGDLLLSFFTVLTATITSFKALWQPTGIAQQLETHTTIGGD